MRMASLASIVAIFAVRTTEAAGSPDGSSYDTGTELLLCHRY